MQSGRSVAGAYATPGRLWISHLFRAALMPGTSSPALPADDRGGLLWRRTSGGIDGWEESGGGSTWGKAVLNWGDGQRWRCCQNPARREDVSSNARAMKQNGRVHDGPHHRQRTSSSLRRARSVPVRSSHRYTPLATPRPRASRPSHVTVYLPGF